MVLFVIYTRQVILTFASVDETSVYESSNDSYGAILYLLLFRVRVIQGDFVYETLSVCFHMTLFTLLNKGFQNF